MPTLIRDRTGDLAGLGSADARSLLSWLTNSGAPFSARFHALTSAFVLFLLDRLSLRGFGGALYG
jgi:hypothetical protein